MSEDLHLNEENMCLFIDLWEKHACLWNPMLRDKSKETEARLAIVEAMGIGWTEDQVKRKVKSLRGHYNNNRRALRNMPLNYKKPPWAYYDRIHRFIGTLEQDSRASSIIQIAHGSPEDMGISDYPAAPPGLEKLYAKIRRQETQPVQVILPSCTSSSPSGAAPPPTPPPTSRTPSPTITHQEQRKRIYPSVLSMKTAETDSSSTKTKEKTVVSSGSEDPLAEAALKLASHITDSSSVSDSGTNSENQTFGVFIAERLGKLKSKRTALRVRREIYRLLDEAIEAELSD